MATETLNIRINQTGARGATRQMAGLAVAMAGVGYAAVRAAKFIVKSADAYTNLKNQTKIFASNQGDAAYRMQETIRIAREMNSSLASVGSVMQRVSLAQESAGIGAETVVKMTENLVKATALSGATAQEAAGALRQFAQGLAANRLSGQELNSVLEQTPLIAAILAKSLRVAVGDLRAMGEAGKLTTKVLVDVFGKEIPELAEMFKMFQFPIEALFASLERESQLFVAYFGENTGVIDRFRGMLEKGISKLESFNDAMKAGTPEAKEMMFYLKGVAGALAGMSVGGIIAIGAVIATMLGPIGLIAIAISGIAGAMVAWSDESFLLGGRIVTLSAIMEVWLKDSRTLVRMFKGDIIGLFNLDWKDSMFFHGISWVRDGFMSLIADVALLGKEVALLFEFVNSGFDSSVYAGFDPAAYFKSVKDGLNGEGAAGGIEEFLFGDNPEGDLQGFWARVEEVQETHLAAMAARSGREVITAKPGGPKEGNQPGGPGQADALQKATEAYDSLRASQNALVAADQAYAEGIAVVNEAELLGVGTAWSRLQAVNALADAHEIAYSEENFNKLTDFEAAQAGMAQGFVNSVANMGSEAQIWATGMTNVFGIATDALTEFVTTGKFDIKSFATTMIAEIQKIILKLLLMKALEAGASAFGAGGSLSGMGGSGAISGLFTSALGAIGGGQRATGGPVSSGTPYLVGEKGPELFVPPASGSIKTAKETASMRPQVNVSVVNVDDPNSVPKAMSSEAGEEVVLNIIQRNSDVLREIA